MVSKEFVFVTQVVEDAVEALLLNWFDLHELEELGGRLLQLIHIV